jgi:hypothetical protein
MPAIQKAQCQLCREMFTVKHLNQKYCSSQCRIKKNNLKSNRMALRNRKLADFMLNQEQIVKRFYLKYKYENNRALVNIDEIHRAGLSFYGPYIEIPKNTPASGNVRWKIYGNLAITGISGVYYIIDELSEEDNIWLRKMYGDFF